MVNNLGRQGERIHWREEDLDQEEKMTPLLEDTILLNVIVVIDSRLPSLIQELYSHKMRERRLMDFKSEILVKHSKVHPRIGVERPTRQH